VSNALGFDKRIILVLKITDFGSISIAGILIIFDRLAAISAASQTYAFFNWSSNQHE
jgi:hypothetical protein